MQTAEEASFEQYLLCRAASRCCALPLAHVVETLRPLSVTPLSNAPDFVSGVSVIRGQALPVLDLSRLLGQPGTTPARYVVVRLETRQAALAVECVLGVQSLPRAVIAELSPLLSDSSAARTVIGSDRALLFVLDASRLIPEAVWQKLDAEGAT